MLFKLKICLKDRIKPNNVRQIKFRLILINSLVNSLLMKFGLVDLGEGW